MILVSAPGSSQNYSHKKTWTNDAKILMINMNTCAFWFSWNFHGMWILYFGHTIGEINFLTFGSYEDGLKYANRQKCAI